MPALPDRPLARRAAVMRWIVFSFFLMVALAFPASAGVEIPLEALYASLARASSPDAARPIEAQLLNRFRHSGSASIDLMLTRATLAGSSGDKTTALRLTDLITELAPGFAEGWRLRAHGPRQAGGQKRLDG